MHEPASDNQRSERERKISARYLRELFGSIAIYIAILLPSVSLGPAMHEGLPRTLVLVSPMIGFLLMLWAIVRHLGRIDEYQRQTTIETFAIAGAITAGMTFTYGFLENAGFPRLSMFVVWAVMGLAWCVAGLVRCRMMGR